MIEIDPSAKSISGTMDEDYQTLFWMPKLLNAAEVGESIVNEMIDMITEFQEAEIEDRDGFDGDFNETRPGRRQQILGDSSEHEVVATRVQVVPKHYETKLTITGILKSHFLFSQLHDYELEDVVDAMQEKFAEEGEVIIEERDEGEKFFVVEEGTHILE